MFDLIFDATLVTAIVFVMFLSGLWSEPRELARVFSKPRISATLNVVVINLLLIPMAGLLLVQVLPVDPQLGMVLLLLAFAPVAPVIPALVKVNNGDVNLAISLFFLLTIGGFITVPIAVLAFLPTTIDTLEIGTVSAGALATDYLAPVFLPLIAALILKWRKADVADKVIQKFALPTRMVNVLLFALIIVQVYRQHEHISPMFLGAVLAFFGICALITVIASSLLGTHSTRTELKTFVIVSSYRNFAVVSLLLTIISDDYVALLHVFCAAVIACVLLFLFPRLTRTARQESA